MSSTSFASITRNTDLQVLQDLQLLQDLQVFLAHHWVDFRAFLFCANANEI